MSEATPQVEPAAPGRFVFLRYMDINPMLVRDIRQVARNWTVIGAVMLLMAVFYFAAVAFMLNGEFSEREKHLGTALFGWVGVPLMIITFCFIPIYVFVRGTTERASINADLLYITSLTPARIIRGKLLSGVYMMVLFYSAAVPFMVFSYLLRGIDLPTISILIGVYAALNIILIQGAITLAAAPLHLVLKIILGLVIGGTSIGVAIYVPMGLLLFEGWLADLKRMNFWTSFVPVFGLFLVNCALVTGLLYQGAVMFITPNSANRSLAFRRYVTLMCVFLVVEFLVWGWVLTENDFAEGIVFLATLFIPLGIMLAVGGRDGLSRRVRTKVPKTGLSRMFAFIFYNGTLGSLLWLAGLWAITMLLVGVCNIAWEAYMPRRFFGGDTFMMYAGTSLLVAYSLAYALFAIWITRRWMPKRSPKWASLIFLLLVFIPYLIMLVLMMMAGEFLGGSGDYDLEMPIPGIMLNVIHTFEDNDSWRTHGGMLGFLVHIVSVLILLVGAAFLNRKWIAEQFHQFKPLEADDA